MKFYNIDSCNELENWVLEKSPEDDDEELIGVLSQHPDSEPETCNKAGNEDINTFSNDENHDENAFSVDYSVKWNELDGKIQFSVFFYHGEQLEDFNKGLKLSKGSHFRVNGR